ncbi:hypothetical protein [Anatilimnocola floriformis]|uniref:hypothetical protein n=1 Tax=Anatilimnocola floriformis TaxID=2948575 RepID=UPI0020C344D0|nr:hypothetical protein [Anatilimnocola floriformis]
MRTTVESRSPLFIVITLLLLPVIYIGSYLALVVPAGRTRPVQFREADGELRTALSHFPDEHYRLSEHPCHEIFWPLEQIDQQIRPEAWMRHMVE